MRKKHRKIFQKAKKKNDFLKLFYPMIKKLLPDYIQEMVVDNKLLFTVVEGGAPNAYVEKDGEQYTIYMTRNLDDLLYWSARIFSFYPEKMKIEEITSRFLDCLWMLQVTGKLKPYCLNDIRGNNYEPFTSVGAVIFFLLHEIGHIMVEHENEEVTDPKQIELLADTYAIRIFTGYYNKGLILYPIHILYKSVLLGFYTFYAKDILENNEVIDHPKIEERLNNINSIIYDNFPESKELLKKDAMQLFIFYDIISKTVSNQSYYQRQLEIIEGKNLRYKKIYGILEEATNNGLFPDYGKMYDYTYSIYKEMEYFIMIPELVDLKKEEISLFNELELLGDKAENAKTEIEKNMIISKMHSKYKKAKLIFGYFNNLPHEYNELIDEMINER